MKTIGSFAAFAILAGILSLAAFAQEGRRAKIEVSGDLLVSSPDLDLPLVEPMLAVNPKDPKHLLAAAMLGPFSDKSDCVSFVSFDGGRSWAQKDFKIPSCADPWLVLREDGVALFSGISQPGGKLSLSRSTDGGRNWSALPIDLGGNHDHQTIVIDRTAGPRRGHIYLVSNTSSRGSEGLLWSIFVTTSADGGKSFTPPSRFVPFNLNFNTLDPAVLSDGTLVMTYKDFQSNLTDFRGREGQLEHKRAWAVTSTDGGRTFTHPRFISEACGLGFGFLAVDASETETRDRLYFVCHNREIEGILVHHSSDGGNKWSAPIRADGRGGGVTFRQTPSVAVNNEGVVGISWYERLDVDGKKCQHLYFTASLDGGTTFLPQQQVSSELSCPDTEQNGRAASRWPAGGDYSGLAADSEGVFHLLWSDSRDGLYRLRTARVTVRVAD